MNPPVIHYMEPISDIEKQREAELEALCRKIAEEDPGYFDRLSDRIIAEAKAEGGSITMEELLGMPPAEEGQNHEHGRRKTLRRQRLRRAPTKSGELMRVKVAGATRFPNWIPYDT
jgi:hypothetical protein